MKCQDECIGRIVTEYKFTVKENSSEFTTSDLLSYRNFLVLPGVLLILFDFVSKEHLNSNSKGGNCVVTTEGCLKNTYSVYWFSSG